MASSPQSHHSRGTVGDWLRPHLQWITVPSWVLSAAAHVAVLFLLVIISQTPSCRSDIQGEDGDSFRKVGIYTPPADEDDSRQDATQSTEQEASEAESQETSEAQPVEESLAVPPVPLDLPQSVSPPLIGIGADPSLPSADSLVDSILSSAPGAPGGPASPSDGEPGGTTFLGASATGNRFVYVIDRSWSMDDYGALRAAKNELASSLQRLDATQQFQIIFYNDQGQVILTSNAGRFDFFWGTDTQRLDAVRQLRSVRASGGTDHVPALQKALSYDPDVVFFLTDGQEPPLSTRDLESIGRRNAKARIHCIEFGDTTRTDAGEIDPGNWVQKLAQQNGGKYIYHDVRTFGRR
ncbi:MAG: VWA domain-containing protein [Planctomycetota bacterium]|nr:MAG: VWA domain-containing protein [Planctomycetota bacterium]REJ90482.1 MAG: VWA domain-containing protein [Planctomycetota bacterium]REK20482.1 MAG: VWA domain-containing protein [Planctomycetota bacterium]REK33855.1 MAG: VWA domain-containing protein [Planctomycetota bacterium]